MDQAQHHTTQLQQPASGCAFRNTGSRKHSACASERAIRSQHHDEFVHDHTFATHVVTGSSVSAGRQQRRNADLTPFQCSVHQRGAPVLVVQHGAWHASCYNVEEDSVTTQPHTARPPHLMPRHRCNSPDTTHPRSLRDSQQHHLHQVLAVCRSHVHGN